MIDFRYHLVSIAAIFLALAVGIVLGAGPLRGPISDTLTSEVTKLREDANALRAEVAAAESSVDARDDIITSLRPRAIEGLLADEALSVLVLPGVADGTVEETRSVLAEANAPAATTAWLTSSWSSQDPPDESDRTSAAAELRELFTGDLPVGATSEEVLGLALSWALTTSPASVDGPASGADDELPGVDPTADPGTSDLGTDGDDELDGTTDVAGAASAIAVERSRQILEVLASHGLVTEDGDVERAGASSVVIIAPETSEAGAAELASWTALITAIDARGSVTIAGDVPEDATDETNLIAAIRGDDSLSGVVSTLDNLTTPVGLAALPFLVAELADGVAGSHGNADSASSLFPPVPAGTP